MKQRVQKLFLGLVVLILTLTPLLTLFDQRQSASFYEQRWLADVPEPTVKTVLNGTFFTELETLYQDHIFGRDRLLKLNTRLELLLDRVMVNQIVVKSDKLLDVYDFSQWDLGYLTDQARTRAEEYDALRALVGSYGGYYCYLGVPQNTTYFADFYPEYMDSRLWHTTGIREAFSTALAEKGVPFINMYQEFQAVGQPEEYYFDSDHHYTSEGAFFTYRTLMEHLRDNGGRELTFLTEEELTFTTLENPFLGSSNRKLYGLWASRDRVTVMTPRQEIAYTRTDNGVPVPYIYQLPASAEETVSYGIYMGGDIAETVIRTDRPELPSILIYGDSFTNPVEALVWMSFNETRCVDFRYYTEKTLTEYIAEYQPDYVVCLRDESVYFSNAGNGATR